MKSGSKVVNNSKSENEKVFKNVSFVIFLLEMCIIFGQEIDAQKRNMIGVGQILVLSE